nr:hypothetical protein 11 [bacterium]
MAVKRVVVLDASCEHFDAFLELSAKADSLEGSGHRHSCAVLRAKAARHLEVSTDYFNHLLK